MEIAELEGMPVAALRALARERGVADAERLKRSDLVVAILHDEAEAQGQIVSGGILEIVQDGVGYLRAHNLKPGLEDIYLSQAQIRRYGLRTGDLVVGEVREPKDNERFRGLVQVHAVNGFSPEAALQRPRFEQLTAIFPLEQIHLETESSVTATRLIDLLAPIGRGQRGLIVSPAKTGKTTILKQIANGVTANHPDIVLMVVLIGERPEEVTDMDRSVDAEVYSSTFDEPVTDHVRVAELSLQRGKRLVEQGRSVVILLDSITRLARAYNLVVPQSGRTLSGGLDPAALYPPKRFFGAARNTEEGGSLTIIATCLVDTGSRMDDSIYEEFKGTGNQELVLSRRLAERRIYPALDIERSSTRREELLLPPDTLARVWLVRRMIDMIGGGNEGAEAIIDRLQRTKSNEEFLGTIHQDLD